MPRKVRDASLESRTARSRLKTQTKPYFRLIEPGVHVGFRKLASGPGSWVVRRYAGDGKYTVENLKAPDGGKIIADDFADADGERVLNFAQAQDRARAQGPSAGPYTVARCMEDYIASKIADGRDVADSRSRIGLHILPAFGSIEVAHLTRDAIQKWHRGMVQEKARIRTSAGKAQQFRVTSDDADTIRRRQATANRCMTILKAGLNLAFQNEKVTTDAAWRKVKPFRGVDTARLRYLTVAEAKRLINVCDPDFKVIVQAALQTGGRYGQLAALTVADFNPDAGTVQMKTRKGDGNWKTYHVHLTAEGAAFFAELCAGRPKKTFLLGKAWYKSEQDPLMREACKRANIDPPMGFHGLRHTYASLSVMNGVPLLVLAKNLGHTTTAMVERHYGHMSASHVADAIRAGAPTFGFKPSKVVALR